jgi:hypothetical protein
MVLLAAFALVAADAITGKWVMTQDFNGMTMTTTFDFKADGAKLTGTATMPGMGPDAQPTPAQITNGKVDGSKISFDITRDMMGNSMTTKYEGTVNGAQMNIKMTISGFGGGEPMSFDGVAKKS